jgi:hypothetical protein
MGSSTATGGRCHASEARAGSRPFNTLSPGRHTGYSARALSPRLTVLASLVAFAACSDTTQAPPRLELYIDGTLSSVAPALTFPDTILGESATTTFELKNLGPGDVELTGRPLILLERDDRLAFRVLQPESPILGSGESLTVTARFVPTAVGPATARLIIAAAHLDEPITVLLAGQGQTLAKGALTVALAGAPPPTRYDFGAVAPGEVDSVTLRLENTGTAPLALGADPVVLTGDDAFVLGDVSATTLAPQETLSVFVSFAPASCGPFSATLEVLVPDTEATPIELHGTGGDNPRKVAAATDTSLLRAPDLDVAVSDPLDDTGKRRVSIGNLTVGSFAGQVSTLGWDGCVASESRVLSATSAGLTATLFGNRVALSDDGRLMLVTARDQRRDAWLFALDPDGTARFLTSLLTTSEAFGHGRGAAMAGDGSTVFIGQTGASNGINTHGALFVYEREDAWGARPDHAFKLIPSLANEVELVGAWVDTSSDGDLVVAGALGAAAGADTVAPALGFLWRRPAGGTWGQPVEGPGRARTEDLRLLTDETPSDAAARVAVSADASVVGLSVASTGGTRVHLYLRDGVMWGLGRAEPTERSPNATLTFPARPELRFSLSATGDLLVAGDPLGILEIDRGAQWAERVVAGAAQADRSWATAVYGRLALSPDGEALVGVSSDGAAWLIAR